MAARKRKPWGQLTPAYRARIVRAGITEEQYNAGTSLAKARGHTSEQREQERRRHVRSKNKYIKRMVDEYGNEEQDLKEEIELLTEEDLDKVIALQAELQDLYMSGRRAEATKLFYTERDFDVANWMLYYHAVFS